MAWLVVFSTNIFAQDRILFGITNVWKYQQTTNFDGINWTAPLLNDSSWPSGPALLYVEDNTAVTPRNTALTIGRNTYYFRSHFQFTNGTAGMGLVFSNLIDDGAVFYLNGNEIQRLRMPTPPQMITYATAATISSEATVYDTFTISGDSLTNLNIGDNVLSVEVHQQSTTSGDIVFGTTLSVTASTGTFTFTEQPTNVTVLDGRPVSMRAATSGSPQPALQWYKNGTVIPGATLTSLTFPSVAPSDSGTYWAIASNVTMMLTSSQASVTVQADNIAPTVLRAWAQKDLTNIVLDFSEPIRSNATNPANFRISRSGQVAGDLSVLSAALSNQSTIYLSTTPRVDRANYELSVTNIVDLSSQSNQVSSAPIPLKYITPLLSISTNVIWRYEQSGVCPSADWTASDFNDSGWPNGGPVFFASRTGTLPPAPVGTQLQLTNLYGNAQSTSYFFRTEFLLPGLTTNALLVRHIIDDGAAFYINGAPFYSIRLALNGACDAFASGTVGIPNYEPALTQSPFSVSNLAIPGINSIAAEVHQSSPNNSDVAFALSLDALIDTFLPGLVLSTPSFTTNGAGTITNAGRVWLTEPVTSNVMVSLSSSEPSSVGVPPAVKLLAGQTNALFDVTVASNNATIGPQRVSIVASANGFITTANKLSVLDSVPGMLALFMPSNIVEANGPFTGRLEIQPSLTRDLTVSLSSSSPSVVGVPPTVLIPAGQTSIVLQLVVPNNSVLEGTRQATITAHVQAWNDGMATVSVSDKPNSYVALNLATRDITYDPITQRIYASVPGSVPTIGNQIVPIAPETRTIEPGFAIGGEPGKVSIGPTGGKLYASVETNRLLKRIDLLSRTTELSFGLDSNAPSPLTIEDFEVLPGSPNPIAVLRLQYGFNADIAIYDEGLPRPNVGPCGGDNYAEIIEASADGTSVYFQSLGFQGFRRFDVNSQGVTNIYGVAEVTPGQTVQDWRTVGDRMVGSDGSVINPLIPQRVGTIPNIPGNSLLLYDSAIQRVFYLVPSGGNWIVQAYEPASLIQAGTMVLSNVTGSPSSFIRWGNVGLAFRTDTDRLYLVKTSLIQTNPPADVGLSLDVSPPPYYTGGNITETLQITNSGPNEAAEVVWTNTLPVGSTVVAATTSGGSITVVSNTVYGAILGLKPQSAVMVTVTFTSSLSGISTLSALVSSSAREINLANNSVLTPLWIQSTGSATSSILNLATKDWVRDPVRNRFYASVGNTATLLRNSLVMIDIDTGAIQAINVGVDPGRLAVSGNGEFLYVGRDDRSGVQRVRLPSLTPDLSFPLPNGGTVGEMAVCPTNSHLVAIYYGQVAMYEDGITRPNQLGGYVGLLAFSDTTGELYTCHCCYSDTPLYRVDYHDFGLSIMDAQPAKPGQISELKFSKGILHYSNGMLLDPKNRNVIAKLPIIYNASLEPDPATHRIYALTAPDTGPGWAIRAFDDKQFIDVGAVFATIDTPSRLLRWGSDGLAFRTATQLYLLHSSLVPTNASTDLVLQTKVSASTALPGETLTYSIGVTNLGTNTAFGVVLTQAFSLTVTGLVASVDSGSISNASNFLTWKLPALSSGVGTALTVSLQAAQVGTLVARGAVRHSANDPRLNNNLGLNVTFIGISSTNELREIGLSTRELVFDPLRQKIYASVPSQEPFLGNSVISIDRVTARIEPLLFAGSEPNQLALSDDSRFLYISLNGTMGALRFDLTGQQPDLGFTFSQSAPYNAFDIKLRPGHPETLAASLVDNLRTSGDYPAGLFLFDNGVVRPNAAESSKSIEFSADGQRIYGSRPFGAGFGFVRVLVTPTGVTPEDLTGDFYNDYELQLQNGALYTALGRVIDPVIPLLISSFGPEGTLAPVTSMGRVFEIPIGQATPEFRAYQIGSYDLIGSAPMPGVNAYVNHLIWCGGDRFAFRSEAGQIYLLRTSLAAVPPLSSADISVSQTALTNAPPPGGRAVFNAIVTNAGPGTVSNAFLSIRPPAGVASFTVVPSQGSVTSIPPGIVCALGMLTPRSSATVQMTATVTNSSVLTNLVSLISDRFDPNLADNTATTVVSVLYAPPDGITQIDLYAAHDLAYDRVSGRLFASVFAPGTNVVAQLNPATGRIESLIPVGYEPTKLAVSSDGQFLYAVVSNGLAISRVHLPSHLVERTIPLINGEWVIAMVPLDAFPRTLVVAQSSNTLVAYDDNVPRPNPLVGLPISVLQAVPGQSQVYAYGYGGHPMVEVYKFSVASDGFVTLSTSPPDLIFYANSDMRLRAGRLLFASGQIVNPSNWTIEATLGSGNFVETDPGTELVFYGTDDGQQTATLYTWNRPTKQQVETRTVSGAPGGIRSLVWAGGDRLAFHSSGRIFIVRTSRIGAADLFASVTLSTNRVLAGTAVTLTAVASNRGPAAATNAVLTSLIPADAALINATSSQGSTGIVSNNVVANLGSIASNGFARLDMQIRFTNSLNSIVTNAVWVTASTPELFPSDNSAALSFQIWADNDRDGLDDDWELEFFQSLSAQNGRPQDDFDGDGISNLQEYLNGTDPTDPANRLRIKGFSFNNGVVQLQFHGVSDVRYQLERASSPQGLWNSVSSILTGEGRSIIVTDAPFEAQSQFYRVRQLP